jgi:hypothetical protein
MCELPRTFDSGPPNVPMQCLSMVSAIKLLFMVHLVVNKLHHRGLPTVSTRCSHCPNCTHKHSNDVMYASTETNSRQRPLSGHLAHWAFRQQRFPSDRRYVQNTPNNKPNSKQPTRRCINPLTPNDLQRRRPASPLKIKISSKNMCEEPTNTPIIHSVY